jgi:cyclophilin family peptidyl-prolyl cis-trans isomerase
MVLLTLGVVGLLQAAPAQVPAPALQPAPGNPIAVISTTMGDITVELLQDKAPASVANFMTYAEEGFYNGTIFHRVERRFVIQGGGYSEALVEKPTRAPILNEATNGVRNRRGTLGMARKRALRSATSQFYINVADNAELDHRGLAPPDFGWAVFGRVLSGMDVVDRIASVETRRVGDFDTLPVKPVVITSVTVKAGR